MFHIIQIIYIFLISELCSSKHLLRDNAIQKVSRNRENIIRKDVVSINDFLSPSNDKETQIKLRIGSHNNMITKDGMGNKIVDRKSENYVTTKNILKRQDRVVHNKKKPLKHFQDRPEETSFKNLELKSFDKYKKEAFDGKLSSSLLSSSSQLPLSREKKPMQCRQYVSEAIMNASDIKDECEGFRRAFDESCSMIQDNHRRRLLSLNTKSKSPIKKIINAITRRIFLSTETNKKYDNHGRNLQEVNNNRYRELPQLSLPTNKHVDYQMITKSLLLQDDNDNKNQKSSVKETIKTLLQSQAQEVLTADSEKSDNKKCCASILSVYHEHCEYKDDDDLNDGLLFGIVAIVACSFLVKSLIRYFKIRWLPEAAGCIIVGSKYIFI